MKILACLIASASVLAFTPACSKKVACPQCGADAKSMTKSAGDDKVSCICENGHLFKWVSGKE
jgi:hypothetical protein